MLEAQRYQRRVKRVLGRHTVGLDERLGAPRIAETVARQELEARGHAGLSHAYTLAAQGAGGRVARSRHDAQRKG